MSTCPTCGFDHPDPEVEVVDTEPIAAAEVEVAQIQADRDITLARISAKSDIGWQEARVTELEGKLAGMAELLDRLAPPPEPEPEPTPIVVEAAPEPEPVEEPGAVPPPVVEDAPRKAKAKNPWW